MESSKNLLFSDYWGELDIIGAAIQICLSQRTILM